MAGVYDLQIDQGATFSQGFQWQSGNGTPINLGGYVGSCVIRRTATSSEVLATADIVVTDAVNGKFMVTMSKTQTASIPTDGTSYKDKLQYVYDVYFSVGTSRYRVINGYAYVSPEVTREAV